MVCGDMFRHVCGKGLFKLASDLVCHKSVVFLLPAVNAKSPFFSFLFQGSKLFISADSIANLGVS